MTGPAFTFAHISDLHLAPPSRPAPAALLNKRLLGFASWRRREQAAEQEKVLEALVRDLRQVGPDHVAVSGDITTLSLPCEFERAAAWLRGLGPPEAVSVVPGNHDAYVRVPWERSWMHWRAFMSSDADHEGEGCDRGANRGANRGDDGAPTGFADFPWVRRRGLVALVGLSTAVPTRPFLATGHVGPAQLKRVGQVLTRLGRRGLFRVVVLHHCPLEEAASRRKGLIGAAALRAVIAGAGAELVLHGHQHRFGRGEIPGPRGPVAVIGVPSASGVGGREPSGCRAGSAEAGYNVIEIAPGPTMSWHLKLTARRFDRDADGFSPATERRCQIARIAPIAPRVAPM